MPDDPLGCHWSFSTTGTPLLTSDHPDEGPPLGVKSRREFVLQPRSLHPIINLSASPELLLGTISRSNIFDEYVKYI